MYDQWWLSVKYVTVRWFRFSYHHHSIFFNSFETFLNHFWWKMRKEMSVIKYCADRCLFRWKIQHQETQKKKKKIMENNKIIRVPIVMMTEKRCDMRKKEIKMEKERWFNDSIYPRTHTIGFKMEIMKM